MSFKGKNQIAGTYGHFWWNGDKVIEISTYEAKVTANREDVQIGLDIDSKPVSFTGEGTFTVKKIYTRNKKEVLEAWKRGEDLRFQFITALKDPDTLGKQQERVTIDNVWLNELILQQFEQGSLCNDEYSFGFTPSSASFVDIIDI